MNNKEEIIKPLNGFEGLYEISNLGYVVGVERYSKNGRFNKRHIIKKYVNPKNGYVYTSIYKNGVNYNKRLHRILAEHFIENKFNKPYINHKDGNRQNNNLDNLEWVTPKENSRHMYDVLGFMPSKEKMDRMRENNRGEKHHKSKLTREQVLEIRSKFKEGKSEVSLANEYKVTKNAIRCIKIGKSWGFLNKEE